MAGLARYRPRPREPRSPGLSRSRPRWPLPTRRLPHFQTSSGLGLGLCRSRLAGAGADAGTGRSAGARAGCGNPPGHRPGPRTGPGNGHRTGDEWNGAGERGRGRGWEGVGAASASDARHGSLSCRCTCSGRAHRRAAENFSWCGRAGPSRRGAHALAAGLRRAVVAAAQAFRFAPARTGESRCRSKSTSRNLPAAATAAARRPIKAGRGAVLRGKLVEMGTRVPVPRWNRGRADGGHHIPSMPTARAVPAAHASGDAQVTVHAPNYNAFLQQEHLAPTKRWRSATSSSAIATTPMKS